METEEERNRRLAAGGGYAGNPSPYQYNDPPGGGNKSVQIETEEERQRRLAAGGSYAGHSVTSPSDYANQNLTAPEPLPPKLTIGPAPVVQGQQKTAAGAGVTAGATGGASDPHSGMVKKTTWSGKTHYVPNPTTLPTAVSTENPPPTEITLAGPLPPKADLLYNWDDGSRRRIPDTFENRVADYNTLVAKGAPSADWGDKPAASWESIYGEGSPFKSDAAKDILGNIVAGVKGQDPALKALAKQQGLAQLMLNRRANAARTGTAANLAQNGLLGQGAGQNAMAGVERSIAGEAAQQSLEQGAQTANKQSELLQQWTTAGLGQMNAEQDAKQAKDSNLLRLYADLAKDSPSSKKAAVRSLESDLGIQTAVNADKIDEYQRLLTLNDPVRRLEQQGLIKANRELTETTPPLPGPPTEELDKAITSVMSASGKGLTPDQMKQLKARTDIKDLNGFTSEKTAGKLGAPVLESDVASSQLLSAGEVFSIGGAPHVITGLGVAKTHAGVNFQEVYIKNLVDGSPNRVWISRSGSSPSKPTQELQRNSNSGPGFSVGW